MSEKKLSEELRHCLDGKGCKNCENYTPDSRLTCPSLMQKAYEKIKEYEELEEIFNSKMTGVACDFLKDKEEFSKWLDRNKWIAKKCDEYARAEEQGKLLKLPVAVGDTVYSLDRFCGGYSLDCPSRPCESCEDYQLEIYEGKFKLNDINDFGKTVFLTRPEAEQALKEMEGKNGV